MDLVGVHAPRVAVMDMCDPYFYDICKLGL